MRFLKLPLVVIFATGVQLFGARLGVANNGYGSESFVILAPNLMSAGRQIVSIHLESVDVSEDITLSEPVGLWFSSDSDKQRAVPPEENLFHGGHTQYGKMSKPITALRPNPLSFWAQSPIVERLGKMLR